MLKVDIKDLFAAGFQYGHKKIKSSPKMKDYIYSVENEMTMIDLPQAVVDFNRALNFLYKFASKKKRTIWFVGTKYRAKELIKKHALSCNQFYINKRWLGGSLTNYECTIVNQQSQLREIERNEEVGLVSKLTKKEQLKIFRHKEKILSLVEGVRDSGLPDLLVVVDGEKQKIALKEALRMNIPTILLMDTDVKEPSIVTYPVPGNDDGGLSIEFFLSKIAETIKLASENIKENNLNDGKVLEKREGKFVNG